MNRRVALTAFFLIPALFIISFGVFPVQALAQVEENENRSRVSFTTVDTLDSSDFARPAASPRSAATAPTKGVKRKPGAAALSVSAKPGESEPAVTGRTEAAENSSGQSVSSSSAAVHSTGDARIDELVRQAAAKYSLDPNLIFAVMRQESGFNPRAISPKGARGLMQLMPTTAVRLGVRDIYDPAQNIDGGARYLRFLLDTFNGDVELALAGYNAGEGAVARYGNRVPPYRETINYVQRISAHYTRLSGGSEARAPRRNAASRAEQALNVELFRGTRTLSQY
ncbi:MAG TPA: lytic transglycosylase domain-containing protein [Blastocatellia bacterium]|nr:lytic transglycosylase domain-containing protein [Blastocatellia bacterium]